MTRIAVIGSLNMDLVVRAPRIPKPGETIIGADDLHTIPGGKGANQAYASAMFAPRLRPPWFMASVASLKTFINEIGPLAKPHEVLTISFFGLI